MGHAVPTFARISGTVHRHKPSKVHPGIQTAVDWRGLTKTDHVLGLNDLGLASGLRAGTREYAPIDFKHTAVCQHLQQCLACYLGYAGSLNRVHLH